MKVQADELVAAVSVFKLGQGVTQHVLSSVAAHVRLAFFCPPLTPKRRRPSLGYPGREASGKPFLNMEDAAVGSRFTAFA
jgi:hypothetical protein